MTASLRLIEPDSVVRQDEAVEEARQLIADLRDAARDSRQLAERYADLLRSVVEEYCGEFEQRAVAVLARLEKS
jgi:hypothetical protein